MIAVLALKKLVSWVSVTVVFCDVRSDSVRAISVTLRSTATPDENSSVPKNSTSISGTITANSIGSDTALVAEQFDAPGGACEARFSSSVSLHCRSRPRKVRSGRRRSRSTAARCCRDLRC